MSDRRLTPANGRVAAAHLEGIVQADSYVTGSPRSVARPVVDLLAAPDGARDRQLLQGASVTVFEDREGWAFVQADVDGYVGYVDNSHLGDPVQTTHRIATAATHSYATESFKSREQLYLPFGAQVTVTDERHKVFETPLGYIPKKHLRPLDRPFADPVTVAQLFFGAPYLWGGNSTLGIDCSGLVQASLLACQIACPGDSDMQMKALGVDISPDGTLARGDLIFWKGHVAIMVDAEVLLHANAHHMACVYEPFAAARTRVKAQGDGDILACKRIS